MFGNSSWFHLNFGFSSWCMLIVCSSVFVVGLPQRICRRVSHLAFVRQGIQGNPPVRRLLTSIMSHDEKDSTGAEKSRPIVVVLAGPTAVGKSDVAAKICADHTGIIVSADSVQAYRGVQIGANKPTPEERQATPHLLIDVVDNDPNTSYNAAEWTRDAMYCIGKLSGHAAKNTTESLDTEDNEDDEDTKRRRSELDESIRQARAVKGVGETHPVLPVVVGGTMMYVQWLVQGRPDAMRPTETALEKAKNTVQTFQSNNDDFQGAVQLASAFGPKFVQQIEKLSGKDWYRLRRISEVAYTVEEKGDESLIDGLYSGQREDRLDSFGYDVRCFFLCPTDRMVHSKIVDERCEQMIMKGLIEETTDLLCAGKLPDMATKAIGYRQTIDFLESDEIVRDNDESAFIHYLEEFSTATRRYSKRQMQWFRRDKDFVFIPISFEQDKSTRVHAAATEIERLLVLSREDFDAERTNPDSINEATRKANEAQGKSMKTYQFVRTTLTDGSKALADALAKADQCRNRFRSKRAKRESTTSTTSTS